MEKLKIKIKGKTYDVSALQTVEEIIKDNNIDVVDPVAAVVNSHLTRLNKRVRTDSSIDIVELNTPQGKQIYESSTLFIFQVAMSKLFPEADVFIQHTIQRGIYAEVSGAVLSDSDVNKIHSYMKDLVAKNLPINTVERDWDEALASVKDNERNDVLNLYRYQMPSTLKLYELEGVEESLYLPLVPATGHLQWFEMEKYQDGIVLILPDMKTKEVPKFIDRPKIFKSYLEYHQWSKVLKVRTVGQLNKYIINDDIDELIKVAEAFHEKRVAQIADEISNNGNKAARLVLIAGPTSSGKTTFSQRLGIQLRVNGYTPVTMAMDNYFVDREDTPLDEDGNYDFEDIKAIDVPLFSSHVKALLAGEEIELPKFDFVEGKKFPSGKKMKMGPEQILVIEGIHGLNPVLTSDIPAEDKFKIYIAPLTQLNIHRHDRIAAADTRLLRRMVRDNFFRGYSASDTLGRWASVRRGEKKNIFPLQEEADAIFNSALFYELSVLKPYAERELLKVTREDEMYAEAQRLLRFLSYFITLQTKETPSTSILKEFIGGSTFDY